MVLFFQLLLRLIMIIITIINSKNKYDDFTHRYEADYDNDIYIYVDVIKMMLMVIFRC